MGRRRAIWACPIDGTDAHRTIGTYDLVHIHWLYNFSCIAAARAALASGVPYIIQPHGSLDPHFRKKNQLVKQVYMATVGWPLLRKAAAVFDTPEEGQLASCAPRRPEWTLPTGLAPEDFDPLPSRGTFRTAFPAVTGPFLLFVGRLSQQKGLDLLLAAFERLTHLTLTFGSWSWAPIFGAKRSAADGGTARCGGSGCIYGGRKSPTETGRFCGRRTVCSAVLRRKLRYGDYRGPDVRAARGDF